jgi:P4 family phage/plasmid primase-like protien
MIISSKYKDLNEFMAKHNAKTDKINNGKSATHTRIGDPELNIYPGAFIIPKEDLPEFYHLYYESIFVKKKKDYLTEKQLDKIGPLAVDFDFRYNYDVETKQHTNEHIQDMIILYLEELKECFVFDNKTHFDIFIFEKPNVNRLKDKSVTKDGIHMLIGIQVDHIMQTLLREKILLKLPETWDLPFINDWNSVLDEGISKGTTNWQLYGSRKPGNEAYELKQHFVISFDDSDGEFMMDEQKVDSFDLKNNFMKLSVQYDKNPCFQMNPKIINIYNKKVETKGHKTKKPVSKTKINLLIDENEEEQEDRISLNEITNKETLKKAVDQMLLSLLPSEHEIKETHDYTQVLPEKYYQPGSHLLNRQVAFALKHTDERLFLSWVMLRSNASDFDYNTIPSLYHDWKKYFNSNNSYVTRRSIMYWAKQDAYEEFLKVKENTIDHYIEETLFTQTEFDIAQVLYQMFKDKFVCSSISNKTWHLFKNHRWEIDKGLSLRLAISKEMYNMYSKKRDDTMNEYQNYEPSDERREFLLKKSKSIAELMIKLKKTNDKNNVMREAMELFYDKEFVRNVDTNKYLLCFNNGVIDFKNKIFRDGYPQDYITKSTRINYEIFDNEKCKEDIEYILQFMEKLFPVESLNKYMWDHLASCLIGVNMNQTFNIYHGSGSNGKSILADLMSHSLGDYKGTVPITLITEKRNSIGGTSSEVMQLKGIRYAVMQEPSKGTKINEGIMKELTGGDPIQGRALYCESETFETQFNLVVCTNSLFDIDSNDDGTWRRIRICDFLSKFVDDDETHTDDTPYVYKKDKTLKDKLPHIAPIFMSMLVQRAFETQGVVEDCDIVLSASNKYRKGQDCIAAFISDRLEKTGNKKDRMMKNEVFNQFKCWFIQEQGSRKIPKGQELYDFLDKKFGNYHKNAGWVGVKILYPEDCSDNAVESMYK